MPRQEKKETLVDVANMLFVRPREHAVCPPE